MAVEKVAIVIPALNEEEALGSLLAELPEKLASLVVVVDNGSTDRTAAVARARGALVVSEEVRGYGRACLRGLLAAKELGAEVVVFMDGDGSDDPADLPAMLTPVQEGRAELAMGSRVTGRAERGAVPIQARLGNWPVEMLVKAARARYRIVEVPLHYRHRSHGHSKVAGTVMGSVKAAYAMLRTTLRYTVGGNHG